MKRSPLKRKTPLRARSRPKQRSRATPSISVETADIVRARSGGRCEARLARCAGDAHHLHHRRLRSQGGRHTAENLTHLCHACHKWAHANPAAAVELGLIWPSWKGHPSTPYSKDTTP